MNKMRSIQLTGFLILSVWVGVQVFLTWHQLVEHHHSATESTAHEEDCTLCDWHFFPLEQAQVFSWEVTAALRHKPFSPCIPAFFSSQQIAIKGSRGPPELV